jgi:hypothetical protein
LEDLEMAKEFKSVNHDFAPIAPSSMGEILEMSWNFYRYWKALPDAVTSKEIVKRLVEIVGGSLHLEKSSDFITYSNYNY